jgi:hypothetical protein
MKCVYCNANADETYTQVLRMSPSQTGLEVLLQHYPTATKSPETVPPFPGPNL